MKTNCVFCKNPEIRARLIAKNAFAWAFPTNIPIAPGHVLIAPLRHVGKFEKTPPTRLPSVNTGLSVKPFETNNMYFLVALDAHSIKQPYTYAAKVNLGTEFGLWDLLKLQAGLMAGQPSAGVQLDLALIRIRFATYAVDNGPVLGLHNRFVDRRFALQLKIII